MFAQLLKEANTYRACPVTELPHDLGRTLRVQFKEFLYYLSEGEPQVNVELDAQIFGLDTVSLVA